MPPNDSISSSQLWNKTRRASRPNALPRRVPPVIGILILSLACLLAAKLRAGERDAFAPELNFPHSMTSVSMTNDGNQFWRVWVTVEDIPGLFALDTGCERTLFTKEFARKIGVLMEPHDKDGKSIPSKNGQYPSAPVMSFQIGDFRYTDFLAPVVDVTYIRKVAGTRFDGIIGMNVLGLSRCEFDWKNQRLTLDRDIHFSNQTHPGIKRMDNRLFIQSQLNGHRVLLELDTGAYSTCITRRTLRHLRVPESNISLVNTPRIDIEVAKWLPQSRIMLDSLEFCGKTRHHEPVMLWEHDVLGMDQLQRWKLIMDARSGCVQLEEFEK